MTQERSMMRQTGTVPAKRRGYRQSQTEVRRSAKAASSEATPEGVIRFHRPPVGLQNCSIGQQ